MNNRIKTKQKYRSILNQDAPINMQKLKKKYIDEQKRKGLKLIDYTTNTQDEVNYAENQVEYYTINTLNYTNSALISVTNSQKRKGSTTHKVIEQVKKSSISQGKTEFQKLKIKQNYEAQMIYQNIYSVKSKANNIKKERKLRRIRSNKENEVAYFLNNKYRDTINQSNKEFVIHKEQTRNYIKQNESKRAKDIKLKQPSYIKQKKDIPNRIKEHEIEQIRMKENYKKNVELKSIKTKHTISKTEKAKKIGIVISTKVKSGALTSILAFGCSLVVIIILIIVMISAFLQSSVGFLFADDSVESEIGDISIGEARDILEQELYEKVEEIKSNVYYDKLLIYAMEPNWKDILSIYAVLGSNRESLDVTSMKEENLEFLRKVFWECCEIEWDTSTYTVKHVYTVDGERVEEYEDRTKLEITLKKTWLDEMVGKYSLSNQEHEQLMELQKPEYQEMWARILAVG